MFRKESFPQSFIKNTTKSDLIFPTANLKTNHIVHLIDIQARAFREGGEKWKKKKKKNPSKFSNWMLGISKLSKISYGKRDRLRGFERERERRFFFFGMKEGRRCVGVPEGKKVESASEWKMWWSP